MQKKWKKRFFFVVVVGDKYYGKNCKNSKKMLLPFLFSVLTFCFVSCGSKSSFTVSDCANEISAEDVTFFWGKQFWNFYIDCGKLQ